MTTSLTCHHINSQEQPIILCVKSVCKQQSVCCQECAENLHPNCSQEIITLDKFVQMISAIENKVKNIQENLEKNLKEIKTIFQDILKPIKDYQNSNNLENLNNLGCFLKYNRYSINEFLGDVQKELLFDFAKIILQLQHYVPKPQDMQQSHCQAQNRQKEQIEQQKQDEQNALDCIEKAIKLILQNEKYLNQKGNGLEGFRRYQEAIEFLKQSISIKSTNDIIRQFLEMLIESQELQKQHESQAQQLFSKSERLQQENDCQAKKVLLQSQELQKYHESQLLFQKCKTFKHKLEIELQKKDEQNALDCIEKAIKLILQNEKYLNQKGNGLEGFCRYQEAIEFLKQSISIKSTNDIIRQFMDMLIESQELQKQHESQAQQSFKNLAEKLQQENDCQAKKWFLQSQELQKTNAKSALNCIVNATQLVPNNQEYLNQQGQCLQGFCLYKEAMECFKKSILIQPTKEAYQQLAFSLYMQNKIIDAVNCISQSLLRFPTDPDLIRDLQSYQQQQNEIIHSKI